MCRYCDGSIKTIAEREYIHVDTCGKTIRIKSYPEGYEDGNCIYIKRNFCQECGRNLESIKV